MSFTIDDIGYDILDVRDIIERYEELEDILAEMDEVDEENHTYDGEQQELAQIESILDRLRGGGGAEKWRGNWYPITLIEDTYFEQYARDLAEDTGATSRDAVWPLTYIDWEQAADALKMDYSSIDIGDFTYHFC